MCRTAGTTTYVYDGVIVRTPWTTEAVTAAGQVGKAVNSPSPVKFANITDGTSSTFMIAEKFVRGDVYDDTGELHYSDDRGWSDGWDADTMRLSCFSPINDNDAMAYQEGNLGLYFGDNLQGAIGGIWNVYHFGSPHTAGINAVFADGSVRSLALTSICHFSMHSPLAMARKHSTSPASELETHSPACCTAPRCLVDELLTEAATPIRVRYENSATVVAAQF